MVAKTPPSHSKRAHTAPADTVSDAVADAAEGNDAGNAATVALLEEAIEPVARAMGYEIVLLEWLGGRGGRIVRVYLDHPNGVSLDDCSRMSRIFSNALDAAEADPQTPALAALLAQPYTLEVSSPGVDRPLRRLSHFARNVGGRAVVRTREPLIPDNDQRTFHGRIVGTEVDPSNPEDDRLGTVLLRALDGDIIYPISLPEIRRANLVYEMPGTPSVKN
jgi:ribosome maturation factor RimP